MKEAQKLALDKAEKAIQDAMSAFEHETGLKIVAIDVCQTKSGMQPVVEIRAQLSRYGEPCSVCGGRYGLHDPKCPHVRR